METTASKKTSIPEFKYSDKMAVFAFMADILESKKITDKTFLTVTDEVYSDFNNFLAGDAAKQAMGGMWTSPSLPWITVTKDLESNMSALFRSPDGKTLVIGVAGTNFVSKYDWFVEDVETQTMVPWNAKIITNSSTDTTDTNGYIATGTATALAATWNAKRLSDTVSFYEALKKLIADSAKNDGPEITNVVVTGHSLGGAIAPVLAQALNEWGDMGSDVTISTYPFAGPTPGDQTFVDHVGKSIQVMSYINSLDVVPHAWQLDKMEEILSLFDTLEPIKGMKKDTNLNAMVASTIGYLTRFSEKAPYAYMRWSKMTASANLYNSKEISFDGGQQSIGKAAAALNVIILGLVKGNSQIAEHVTVMCGTTEDKHPVDAALPRIHYFSQFLAMLAAQHIPAYSQEFMNNEEFISAKKAALKISQSALDKAYTAKVGAGVLIELFKRVATANG